MSIRGRSTRAVVLILGTFGMLAAPVHAQRGTAGGEPPRPRLAATADTNDASAYHRHAIAVLSTDARQAARAFHWTLRLDPTRQNAVYGMRIAVLLQDKHRLVRYMDGDRQVVRSADMRAADSLYLRSLMMDPFTLRDSDRLLLNAYAEEWARAIEARNRNAEPGAVRYAIDTFMRQASPAMRAWFAYTEREYDTALRHYGTAAKSARNKAWLHAERAHILFLLRRLPEAEAEMQVAVTEARKRDEKHVVHFYDSKALYEYSRGYVLQAMGRFDDALEAYGRTLQEDLSYYPAHSRTASILLHHGDTTAALGSLALAASIESVDANTRLTYGLLLAATGDAAGAEAEFSTLNRVEPYFARPYAERGYMLEKLGRPGDAIAAYDEFLERSARSDPTRPKVAERLQELRRVADAGAGT